MKKIGIMQPYFFPYIGYWQLINSVDVFVVYDDVNYIKNGWINRNNILLNKSKHLITLPLQGASSFSLINEIKIVSNSKIKQKLLKTVGTAYSKAPNFSSVFPIIEETVCHESEYISDAIFYSIKEIIKYLKINTEIVLSSSLLTKNNDLTAQDKVINICKLLNGSQYINSIGGMELYNKDDFKQEGIDLKFIKPNLIEYNQVRNDFVPGLSIIDVMMYNNPDAINNMLNNYELI